jgi:hypothetical protein
MAADPATMLAQIDAALAEAPAGAASIRFSDGKQITYRGRIELLQERAYWQRLVDAAAGSGLHMCRASLLGDDA